MTQVPNLPFMQFPSTYTSYFHHVNLAIRRGLLSIGNGQTLYFEDLKPRSSIKKIMLQGADYMFFFDSIDSLRERLNIAVQIGGVGGACYWTVGDELNGFFDMVKSIIP